MAAPPIARELLRRVAESGYEEGVGWVLTAETYRVPKSLADALVKSGRWERPDAATVERLTAVMPPQPIKRPKSK